MEILNQHSRDIDKLIFRYCNYVSLFTLRRCSRYLYATVRDCCYSWLDNQLYVNSLKIGWSNSRLQFYTDEYYDDFQNCFRRNYFDGIGVNYHFSNPTELVDSLSIATTYRGKIVYQDTRDRKEIRTITRVDNGIDLMDIYIHFDNFRYAVICCIGLEIINIYTRKGLIFEINYSQGKKIVNHINPNKHFTKHVDDIMEKKNRFSCISMFKFLILEITS